MFGLESLDIMIGLITVYLAFGMVCTAIVEAVMSIMNTRSSNLETALGEFLDGSPLGCKAKIIKTLEEWQKSGKNKDKDTDKTEDTDKKNVDQFYEHPLVQSLSKGAKGKPSYIPPEIVSQVIMDIMPINADNSRLKGIIDALKKGLPAEQDQNQALRKEIETHFDNVMDRASGWVKRSSRRITLFASVVLVVSFNIDTINIYNSLADNPAVRLELVKMAQQQLNDATGGEGKDNKDAKKPAETASGGKIAPEKVEAAKAVLTKTMNDLESAKIQLGWKVFPVVYPVIRCQDYPMSICFSSELPKKDKDKDFVTWERIIRKVFGLLISIFAISLGAPFWFDVLQKFMQIRSSGVSPRDPKKQKTS